MVRSTLETLVLQTSTPLDSRAGVGKAWSGHAEVRVTRYLQSRARMQVSSCEVTIGFAAFGHHFMPIGFKAETSSAALYLPTFSIFY